MAVSVHPPKIHTYHCLCTSLLLASTHTLSSLPRRTTNTGGLDAAVILPLPAAPPSVSPDENEGPYMPVEGYTMLLGLAPERKLILVRREDGFEKRILHRCTRCKLVVGYELQNQANEDAMDVDGEPSKGKGKEEGFTGRVIYLLPSWIMSTDIMMGQAGTGRKVGEDDVDLKSGTVAAFE